MNRTLFVVLSVSIGLAMAVVGCRSSQEVRENNVAPVEKKQLGFVLTGDLTGNVFDLNGVPLKGIKVLAKSDAFDTQKTAYTDAEGYFRIAGLQSGTCEVIAITPGVEPTVLKKISIGASAEAVITIIMEFKIQLNGASDDDGE